MFSAEESYSDSEDGAASSDSAPPTGQGPGKGLYGSRPLAISSPTW
jgi:hypothetical protein